MTLTKGLSRFLDPNQQCQTTLRGSGFVNFRQRAARWTVAMPGVFQGALKVVAIRGRTYVNARQFARGRARRPVWVKLSTAAEYKTFDKLPFLRDVIVLSNPLRSLDVLRSVKVRKRASAGRAAFARASVGHALSGDSPSLTASCERGAKPVATNDSVDAKHLADQVSIGGSIDENAIKAWAQTKISAEADGSGVCSESISVKNADADGFDIVLDFTTTAPKDKTIKTPQSTATVEWKAIYHVKRPPCLDGTWETTVSEPLPGVLSGSYLVYAKALISASAIEWQRDYRTSFSAVIPVFIPEPFPEPPYETFETDTTTVVSNYDAASGTLVGGETSGGGDFQADVTGAQIDTVSDSLGLLFPAENGNMVMRPMTLTLNCAAGTLTVAQNDTLAISHILAIVPSVSQTLHKTSAALPPRITVEQNWRDEISAPVQSGS